LFDSAAVDLPAKYSRAFAVALSALIGVLGLLLAAYLTFRTPDVDAGWFPLSRWSVPDLYLAGHCSGNYRRAPPCFSLAAYLRFRRWPALRAIGLASLVAPLAMRSARLCFRPIRVRTWWRVTVVPSVFFGPCAAAAGYLLVGLVRRQRT
jgi:hypothetical protein